MKVRRCPICEGKFKLYERRHVRDLGDKCLVWRCERGCYETVADTHDRQLVVERVENPYYREGGRRAKYLWLPDEWDSKDFNDPVGRKRDSEEGE
jgi:hypothetical protein